MITSKNRWEAEKNVDINYCLIESDTPSLYFVKHNILKSAWTDRTNQ